MNKKIAIKITILTTLLSLLYTPLRGYSQMIVSGVYLLAGIIISIIIVIMKKRCSRCDDSPHHDKTQPPRSALTEAETIDHGVVDTLEIFQKDGRLIDFLKEDISGYSDEQVGAAVRTIHKGCLEALNEYVVIEPVIDKKEGSEVTIEGVDYDPSSISLIGNVSAKPPYKGILQHSGWRVRKTEMPKRLQGKGQAIVQPAEIEIP